MRYRVFGEVALLPGQGPPRPMRRRRERTVLAVLLAAHGRPLTAERLLADVWGESAGSGLGSLQVAVSRLRADLEPDRSPRDAPRLLVSTGGGYALEAGTADVDVWQFESLADRALASERPGHDAGPGRAGDRVVDGGAVRRLRHRAAGPRAGPARGAARLAARAAGGGAARPGARPGGARGRHRRARRQPLPRAAVVGARARALPRRAPGRGAGDAADPPGAARRRARRRPDAGGAGPRAAAAPPGRRAAAGAGPGRRTGRGSRSLPSGPRQPAHPPTAAPSTVGREDVVGRMATLLDALAAARSGAVLEPHGGAGHRQDPRRRGPAPARRPPGAPDRDGPLPGVRARAATVAVGGRRAQPGRRGPGSGARCGRCSRTSPSRPTRAPGRGCGSTTPSSTSWSGPRPARAAWSWRWRTCTGPTRRRCSCSPTSRPRRRPPRCWSS